MSVYKVTLHFSDQEEPTVWRIDGRSRHEALRIAESRERAHRDMQSLDTLTRYAVEPEPKRNCVDCDGEFTPTTERQIRCVHCNVVKHFG